MIDWILLMMMVHITKVVFSVLKQITVLYVALMEEGNMSNLYNRHPCLFRAQLLQSDQKKNIKGWKFNPKCFQTIYQQFLSLSAKYEKVMK